MTFRSLALSNVRGNWRAYSAFLLSSIFSVLIFYLYAAFLFHPDVRSGEIRGAAQVKQGMLACEFLIMIFSFFFVLYSNSAFMKTRKKEFGLFTLFGMTRGQIRKMVLYEGAFIAAVSIAAGIGLGMLFSKLFFLALGMLLGSGETIPFAVPQIALWVTIAGFFALFMTITALTLLRVGRSQIVELLREARKPKPEPRLSVAAALAGFLTLAGGYALALTMNTMTFLVLSIPVIGLTVVGTYFLFSQGSVAVLRLLMRRRRFYYNRTHMLTVSQLVYKMKDNARLLFVISVMSAVVLSASGTVYVFQKLQKEQIVEHTPYAVGFVERGANAHQVVDPAEVERILQSDGLRITREQKLTGLLGENLVSVGSAADSGSVDEKDRMKAMIVSERDYNREAQILGRKKADVAGSEAALILPYKEMESFSPLKIGDIRFTLGGKTVALKLASQMGGAIASPVSYASYMLVVDDALYETLRASAPPQSTLVSYGYDWANWEHSEATVDKIDAAIDPAYERQAQTYRVPSYASGQQSIALTLFIGLFISLLFFVAMGSLIYFKLFTELQDDQTQFKALARIGMTAAEIRRIVVTQVGLVFLLPCLVGSVHALIAIQALGNLLHSQILKYAAVVFGIYIVMQAAYFAVTCATYLRSIRKGGRTATE
ncbi:ABC transporter permease [Cohnella sp. JJ-181]|uniref:ABC transporter permease n=1 Tax=Cohnella rhizoplanae TaxID=2974897 RepID=UPI0022FFBE70|nr:ABC transporter permease [Cohnella sp. JJ-181]CAI6020987.1 ABC transporter permease protein YxdM [Cohnella sp. JJ-181]